MLQLILAPGKGWEDVSGTMTAPEVLAARYVYPLMGLGGVSVFLRLIYNADLTFSGALVKAFVTFVSLFFTYFFALGVFKYYFYLLCEGSPNERKIHTVISYCVCILSMFTVILNVLPEISLLQWLLPLAVTLIAWKSDRYLRVRSDRGGWFVVLIVVTLILPSVALQSLFNF